MGKSSINGPFSIAMLNNQRVTIPWFGECELSSKKLGLTRGRILVMYSNVANE